MMTPVTRFIDQLSLGQEGRHAWISEAAEKVRGWEEEDRLNGVLWGVASDDAALVGLRPEPASRLGQSATITNAGEAA